MPWGMSISEIGVIGENLARPLNEGVNRVEAGQFALMLSLYQEGLYHQRLQRGEQKAAQQSSVPNPVTTSRLDVAQARAFQAGESGGFNLLRSLLHEVPPPAHTLIQAEPSESLTGDQVLNEINQAKSFGVV